MSQIWDVVIVGAGLSGLSSAHRIKKRNPQLKIIILEGKDRVGGRTVTEDLPAVNGPDQWDLGGQWVSSSQTHVMELIQELGLEVYPQYTAGKKIQHIGGPGAKIQTYSTSIPALSPLVMLDLGQLLWKINRLCSSVSVDEPSRTPNAVQLDSMTLHSYVEKHAWTQGVKQQMSVCSRVVFGLEPSQMSLLFFLLYAATAGGVMALLESSPGSAQEFRVKGGTQQLSQGLAEGLGSGSVCLSQPVTAIWQDGECVRVRTATDSFLGRVAIVTCPPHLAAKIEYQPALPVQREQLTHSMAPGHLIKFVITYKTAFWREKGFSGEIVAQASEACPFCVTFDATSPHGSPALLGFMGGLQAYSWSSREAEERREAVVSSLAMYLGPEASSYIHYREKDWATEEFSGGCPVSVMSPGLLSYHHPSLRRPYGRIHWAGTETATQWCGYMSGALQSGERAALEVLERLCPSSLTEEELEAVHKALATPQHLQAPPQHLQAPPSSSSALVRGACLFTATVGLAAALLLARPQLCRQLIGQALQRVGLRI